QGFCNQRRPNSIAHFGVDCRDRAQSAYLVTPLRKGTRPNCRKPISASAELAECLGSGRLLARTGCQKSGSVSSANRTTRHPRRQGRGAQYRGCTLRSSAKIVFVQDNWVAGVDWSSRRGRAHLRLQFFRFLGLVDVADDLPEQTTRLRQESSGGIRLDT